MNEVSPAPGTTNPTGAWRRVIRSDAFIEKALLLVLTALLTGLLIPFVTKAVDRDRENRDAIAKARAKLFDDVSETILTTETLMLDVSWFGTRRAKNSEMQRRAFERYTERSVELISRWRIQTSRTYALASKEAAQKLEAFQIRSFEEQDTPMNELWAKCATECDWQGQHSRNEKTLMQANMLIVDLAKDLELADK